MMLLQVTTVPARHASNLKRVLHFSARQCPDAQGTRGNQIPPPELCQMLSEFKNSSKTDSAITL